MGYHMDCPPLFADELLAMVFRGDHAYLDIYRWSDVNRISSIQLPDEIDKLSNAVQSLNGHFIIAHTKKRPQIPICTK